MPFSLSKNKTPFPGDDNEKLNLVYQCLSENNQSHRPLKYISDYFDWTLQELDEIKLKYLLDNSEHLEIMSLGNLGHNAYKLKVASYLKIIEHGSFSNWQNHMKSLKPLTEKELMNIILNQLNTKPVGHCHYPSEISTATSIDEEIVKIICRKIDALGDCSYHQDCTSINPEGKYRIIQGGYKDEVSSGTKHYHGSVLQVGRDLNAPIVQDSSLVDSEITHKVKITPDKKEAITRQTGLRKFINNPIVKWIGGILTGLLIAYLIYYLGWN